MKYVTGIHALNMICNLNTDGDWHQSALRWEDITIRNSEESFFGNYGIEKEKAIPYTNLYMPTANHIRACLDLIYERKFSVVQGMKDDFIVVSEYDNEIFKKVYEMKNLDFFNEIDDFMKKEYLFKWTNYKEAH